MFNQCGWCKKAQPKSSDLMKASSFKAIENHLGPRCGSSSFPWDPESEIIPSEDFFSFPHGNINLHTYIWRSFKMKLKSEWDSSEWVSTMSLQLNLWIIDKWSSQKGMINTNWHMKMKWWMWFKLNTNQDKTYSCRRCSCSSIWHFGKFASIFKSKLKAEWKSVKKWNYMAFYPQKNRHHFFFCVH